MNEQGKPRLIESASEETRKPEELDGQDITILKAMETRMPDGRNSAKWAVRLADGSTGIFWAAGQDPTLKVAVWFMDYPNTPLPCRIWRESNKYGTRVWHITQREEDEYRSSSGDSRSDSLDAQLAQAGMA